MSKGLKKLANALTPADLEVIKFRQENPTLYKNHILGLTSTLSNPVFDYKAMGYGKAAKASNPLWGESRDSWSDFNVPQDIAEKAFTQQTIAEMVGDVVVGGAKRFGAGFIDSVGAWDISNMTAMAMNKTNVDYSNFFNRIGKKLTDSANEENQIYQDPNGSIWNGAYFANQVQQLGYTGGIVAEMIAEQLALTAMTGGSGNTAALAKGAALWGRRAGQ